MIRKSAEQLRIMAITAWFLYHWVLVFVCEMFANFQQLVKNKERKTTDDKGYQGRDIAGL